jgi:hypothetical protein
MVPRCSLGWLPNLESSGIVPDKKKCICESESGASAKFQKCQAKNDSRYAPENDSGTLLGPQVVRRVTKYRTVYDFDRTG